MKELPNICLVWPYFGPQYYDRFIETKEELRGSFNVKCIALSNRTAGYPFWKETYPEVDYCFYDKEWEYIPLRQLYEAVYHKLSHYLPVAVFSHSYATIDARACISYCHTKKSRLCIMSETKEDDFPRFMWSEFIKSIIIKSSDGMLVSHKSHLDYFRKLGCKSPIFIGYEGMSKTRLMQNKDDLFIEELRKQYGRFLICVARPIARKRIAELISTWREIPNKNKTKLVIIGGDIEEYNVSPDDAVIFAGKKSQREAVNHIAASIGLVLPSSEDQWGNVVNEALILGKRAIVSSGCGASSLIKLPSYGYVFSKNNWVELRGIMAKFIFEESKPVDRLPCGINVENFAQSVLNFSIDSYRSSKSTKILARLLIRATLFVYPKDVCIYSVELR